MKRENWWVRENSFIQGIDGKLNIRISEAESAKTQELKERIPRRSKKFGNTSSPS